jgi:hypothetical protein
VEKADMGQIYIAFVPLEVIALVQQFERHHVGLWQRQEGEVREKRRFSWPQISIDHATPLDAGIRGVANVLAQLAPSWLTRLFQAPSFNVIEPTMIDATYPTAFESAITEISPSVRAVKIQEPDSPLIVPEEHKRFAENLDGLRSATGRNLL